MKTVAKKSMTSDLMEGALSVAGGVAANQLTSTIEAMPSMAQYQKYVPLGVALISVGALIFLPKNSNLRPLALGAIAVSGTEQAEGLLAGVMQGTSMLGFVPQIIPQKFQETVQEVNGIPVR